MLSTGRKILQIIEERRLIFVRNNEGRITLVDCATVEQFRELLSLSHAYPVNAYTYYM